MSCMRKVMIFLVCIVLCSCAVYGDLTTRLDQVFSSAEEKETIRRNNYSSYIDYYVPSDTSELNVSPLSTSFIFNNSRMIMDVNISGIINSKYYEDQPLTDEGFFDENKLVYSHEGNFMDSEGELNTFIYKVYEYEKQYLTYFTSRDLIFYAFTNEEDIEAVTSRILLMAKGASVKEGDVIANFSSKEVIDYEKKQVNLFETIMPVNGHINDFMVDQSSSQSSE